MKIESLGKQIDDLKTALNIINQKREIWQTKIKPLIIDTLTKITKEYPIGWNVQILDWTKNSEGVNITFGPERSGIIEKTESTFKSYIKEGGTIAFSQAYNGDIFVIIIFPFIDKLVSQTDNKLLGKFNPEIISEDFIIKHVSTFLDEMIKWEKSTYGNRVGFKTEK